MSCLSSINVLKGEMSVVGPRPPLASNVQEYKLSHLRRLDVTPGITGLWQVQGRQDPSFASYVSLDVTYIDNWSLWLDFKIIVRTIAVVFAWHRIVKTALSFQPQAFSSQNNRDAGVQAALRSNRLRG